MSKFYHTPSQVFYVCGGDKCKKRGGKEIGKMLRELCKDNNLKHQVEIIKTECTDRCKHGPIVCLQPQNLWLYETTETKARRVFDDEVMRKPKPEPPTDGLQ